MAAERRAYRNYESAKAWLDQREAADFLRCRAPQRERSRKMRIIVILLSLTALGLSACQGNRLNGSASSSVAIGASGFHSLRGQG